MAAPTKSPRIFTTTAVGVDTMIFDVRHPSIGETLERMEEVFPQVLAFRYAGSGYDGAFSSAMAKGLPMPSDEIQKMFSSSGFLRDCAAIMRR
jgi:hypothetical protein